MEQKRLYSTARVGEPEDEDVLTALDDVDLVSAVIAEFLASFMVALLAVGSVYASAVVTADVVKTDRILYIALGYGMSYGAALYAFSYPAGDNRNLPNIRHINPVITLMLTIFGRLGFGRAMLYWLAQLSGAAFGVMVLYYNAPFATKDVTSLYPTIENVTVGQGWVMEITASFLYILTVLMTSFHHWRQQPKQPSVLSPLAENSPFTNHELNCVVATAIVFVCGAVCLSVSGGYMNPFMSIAVGLLSDKYPSFAIVGSLVGGLLAFLVSYAFGYAAESSADYKYH